MVPEGLRAQSIKGLARKTLIVGQQELVIYMTYIWKSNRSLILLASQLLHKDTGSNTEIVFILVTSMNYVADFMSMTLFCFLI